MSFFDNSGRSLLGVGIYTVHQAARLVRLPIASVEHVIGPGITDGQDVTTRLSRCDRRTRPRFWRDDHRFSSPHGAVGSIATSGSGRAVADHPLCRSYAAARVLKILHPLTHGHFRTEGRKVFLSLKAGKRMPKTAIDLVNRQQVFEDVVTSRCGQQSSCEGPMGGSGNGCRLAPKFMAKCLILSADSGNQSIQFLASLPLHWLKHIEQRMGMLRPRLNGSGRALAAVKDAAQFEKWLNRA